MAIYLASGSAEFSRERGEHVATLAQWPRAILVLDQRAVSPLSTIEASSTIIRQRSQTRLLYAYWENRRVTG